MRKDQFENKHRNLQLSQAELERKWKLALREQENQRIFEALQQQAAAQGLAGGGGNFSAAYMPGDYMAESNDYVD